MSDSPTFRWRSIALPVLLPSLLFAIGEGAVIPVIATVAANQGAGLALAGLIAAALTLGELVGNLPSGWLIAKIGERRTMIGAGVLGLLSVLLCSVSTHPFVLGLGILLLGVAASAFALARHAFLTSFVPHSHRARALSTLGGTFRLGFMIGPFVTAAVIALTGLAENAFWIAAAGCVAAILVLLFLPDPASTFGVVSGSRTAQRATAAQQQTPQIGVFRTIRDRRRVLLTVGLGAAGLSALRSSRQVILPLWALSIGVADSTTALVIGIAGGVDFALFYLGGALMDRFGRLSTALPAMLGLGAGHVVLALTHDLTAATAWFVFAAMLLAFSNGVSSGILMTLGADLADQKNPAPFLGAWRLTTNIGGSTAPLLLSGITAIASISIAAASMGVVALVGTALLAWFLPRNGASSTP
ncbi:MFS transporter [Humidisolicoccus flavus]|uniref:MFS transporter n=1 Tax=Humidisolicoccus flavus TaxID=3111414 RepID=UPI003245FB94